MNPSVRSPARRWLIYLLLAAAIGPGGYYVARRQVWPAYRTWRQARLIRLAQSFLAAKDYDNVLLTARQALRDNRRDLACWRLAAAAARAKDSPDVIYYQENLTRLDKSLANQLDLIRLALQYGYDQSALETIRNIDAAARQSPEFHELAAQVYRRLGQTAAAELQLESLVELRSDDYAARLDLAALQLARDPQRKNRPLRDEVRKLSQEPALRMRALALLLSDANAARDGSDAVTYADQIQNDPTITDEQRVLVLAGLELGAPGRAADYLGQLEASFADDVPGIVALIDHCSGSGRADEAIRWFRTLPEKTRIDPAVAEATAAALVASRDWAQLEKLTTSGSWKERDYAREAFASLAARRRGLQEAADNAWKLAVIKTGDSARNIVELLRLVARWGWDDGQYDLMWKLFSLMPRNQAISGPLLAWERRQGHTANLNRLFARLVEVEPDDRAAKNNFAYSSLLLDANLADAYRLALEDYRADPSNPYYVTTQAFALYKQSQPAQALALLETLHLSDLSAPERMLMHALLRAGAGDAAGAADLLTGVNLTGLLPEERRLVRGVNADVARTRQTQGENSRLYALEQQGGIDRRKGWLQALPEDVRVKASGDMRTADALFALGDLRGLRDQLRRMNWDQQDHLRLALIAYVARSRQDADEARSYWRTALGAAAGDTDKLRQLGALATHWNWQPERMEALARVFGADPNDLGTRNELMRYYRSTGQTSNLVAVLNAYLSAHPDDQAERCGFAYYSMLSGLNISQAYVIAKEAYDAEPGATLPRLVYAFALWKQRRPQEAWGLLEHVADRGPAVVPAPLLRAAVLADLNRRADAERSLEDFDATRALPEEATLATVLESRLKEYPRVSRL